MPAPKKSANLLSNRKSTPRALSAARLTSSPVPPIVGIGASAGGLEALEIFLEHVPAQSGLAFVIVQHLDPTVKDAMAELLQRHTSMPVHQVEDQMRVLPDHVYIIPPNKDLSILHGVLYLLEPVTPRGLRLPIDFFFRALADDQQEHSLGVLLSGMGSDGTLGLQAIKEKAGVGFVQEPTNAKFDSMPRAAIEAGVADVIAPVEALPDHILTYLHHTTHLLTQETLDPATEQSAMEKVVLLLRAQTGHDFSLYKKSTVMRRIERRMGLRKMKHMADYVQYLRENAVEVDLLFRELLIGVTSFFRDPEAWVKLQNEIFPGLLTERIAPQTLRAWIPACATGEEAYSLAILLHETLEQHRIAPTVTIQIFATDLDEKAIEKAREGLYPANIVTDVSAQRLERYFVKTDRGYQVVKTIREMIIFAPQNLIMDPPFTKLDLISCRNLLIYLTSELQKQLFPLFHYSLNPGGILFLGSSESIGNFTHLFAPLEGKTRLYRRLDHAPAGALEFRTSFTAPIHRISLPNTKIPADLQTLTDQLLLQKYAPASVLTNNTGDILYISGRTGKYLEPAAGKANWNIFLMAREGLRYEMIAAFQNAVLQKEAITLKNMVVEQNHHQPLVNITIQPLSAPKALEGMVLFVFQDIAPPVKSRKTKSAHGDLAKLAEIKAALEQARYEVQIIREEMQSSQEELTSANEELQSTNEELQSTNEELTTSKEELQSMNEELHTVNRELLTRLDEISRVNNDMKNLLDSTDIATLFLDNHLHVRRFTSETSKITRLLPGDIGRPITDIASALLYPELAEDARQVLRTLVKIEKQITTAQGTWFAARILPYRTLENMIDGVVITFTDITKYKHLEAELHPQKDNSKKHESH